LPVGGINEKNAGVVTAIWDGDNYPAGEIIMPTVRYTVIDGSLVAEKRNGVRSLYVPDSLGSTVALLDNTQTQTDQWSYMPYGESKRLKGSNPTPFLYGGGGGMRTDSAGRIYARARVVEPPKARWLTQDPIILHGTSSNLYVYVWNRPTVLRDPSGALPPPVNLKTCNARAYLAFLDVCKNRTQFAPPEMKACMDELCKRPFNIVPLPWSDPWCSFNFEEGDKYRCGLTLYGSTNTIYLCPQAFNENAIASGGCDCLGKTIMHEMCHVCNEIGRPVGTGIEKYCEGIAGSAWSFKATVTMGIPDCHGNGRRVAL
jgi:RHS repeat-associated protein